MWLLNLTRCAGKCLQACCYSFVVHLFFFAVQATTGTRWHKWPRIWTVKGNLNQLDRVWLRLRKSVTRPVFGQAVLYSVLLGLARVRRLQRDFRDHALPRLFAARPWSAFASLKQSLDEPRYVPPFATIGDLPLASQSRGCRGEKAFAPAATPGRMMPRAHSYHPHEARRNSANQLRRWKARGGAGMLNGLHLGTASDAPPFCRAHTGGVIATRFQVALGI